MSLTIYYTLSPFAAVLGTNGEQQLLSAPSTPHCSHIPGIQERGYEEVEGTQDKFWRASFQKVSEEWLATALAVLLSMDASFSLLHAFVP